MIVARVNKLNVVEAPVLPKVDLTRIHGPDWNPTSPARLRNVVPVDVINVVGEIVDIAALLTKVNPDGIRGVTEMVNDPPIEGVGLHGARSLNFNGLLGYPQRAILVRLEQDRSLCAVRAAHPNGDRLRVRAAGIWVVEIQRRGLRPIHADAARDCIPHAGVIEGDNDRVGELARRHRQGPDPLEHRSEQASSQVALGQQEPVVPRVCHQAPARLDEALLDADQRPRVDPRRQYEPPPQIAQVVREHAQLQPDLVRPEPGTRQSCPVRRLLAFLDPLLGGPARV
jgi:hypothetical protein